MTRKTVIILEDDLDGSNASETVQFSIDGAEYEIDLNEEHANELRQALSRFATCGTSLPVDVADRQAGGPQRVTPMPKPFGSGPWIRGLKVMRVDESKRISSTQYQATH